MIWLTHVWNWRQIVRINGYAHGGADREADDEMQHVFLYCERGPDPGFWGEPINALSNLAFLVAAAAAWRLRGRIQPDLRPTGGLALILIVAVIGLGSFLFHTLADRWSALADVVPIGVFMLAYVAAAFDGLLRAPRWLTATAVATFAATVALTMRVRCPFEGGITLTGEGGPCLNGSLSYAPALLAMAGTGVVLLLRGERAGRLLLAAAAVFTVSFTARTLDRSWCSALTFGGTAVGSHFVWHLLNGLTLYLLLAAYLQHGRARPRPQRA